MQKKKKIIKPAQFVEQEIITEIVSGKWTAGYKLPPERELAGLLGVTRPTLREVLQRLSRDGWLTIKHGKPTTVNDYQETGGLGVLKTLVKHDKLYSKSLINDWLEFRIMVFPALASKAISKAPELIIEKLNEAPGTNTNSNEFAAFDWEIQMLMVKLSENSIGRMLYNDLSSIYKKEGFIYFNNKALRQNSVDYYKKLKMAIYGDGNFQELIKYTMEKSYELWKKLKI